VEEAMVLGRGEKLVPFRLKNVDGQTVSSDDLMKGAKAVCVIFSCNHCPYVQAWEDRMIDLGRKYKAKGVAFALINANDPAKYPEDGFPEMTQRAKAKGYPFPYLHDEDQTIARAYGATRTPEAFLFDSKGTMCYHGRIDDNYENPQAVRTHDLREALEAILAGRIPAMAETAPVGCTIKWK
jgi:peroxiredoxin